ncbi:tRNA 2-selenouridine(34) synthase MnmH [Calidifontibacillus oryziterrae]|uniref:tRNA 2-selenouridine(34) synthase MnmH n=1 Tax=Calidifontibacillus oryziterrae TaxID=1191699 RepID=UPI0002F52445|nr:tRNA 2-selenouridine(34) synthase MnmH [Calidifontibacillus oryziterrae]
MLVSIPTISITEALKENSFFIDVRSPAEYEEFHIDGAINIPLFSNDERAQIGTIYKQVGQEEAKELGVKFLASKLSELYAAYKDCVKQQHHKKIIVYCWRGGMRSGSIVTFMAMMNLPLIQLEGGIRSFRKLIQSELESFAAIKRDYIVLEGNTGTHKTDILQALQKEGYPVLDLEGLAGHRGSTFGGIGLKPKSQKEFERDLWKRLWELKNSRYFIVEAESKRIGRIVLPQFIVEGKEAGARIHLHAPIESRIKAICETYQFQNYHEEFERALEIIKKRMKPDVYLLIKESLATKDYETFVRLLLEEYYDPRYTYASNQYDTPSYELVIEHTVDGISKVREQINNIVENNRLLTT